MLTLEFTQKWGWLFEFGFGGRQYKIRCTCEECEYSLTVDSGFSLRLLDEELESHFRTHVNQLDRLLA